MRWRPPIIVPTIQHFFQQSLEKRLLPVPLPLRIFQHRVSQKMSSPPPPTPATTSNPAPAVVTEPPKKATPLTHFLSLPLHHAAGLDASLSSFAEGLRGRGLFTEQGGVVPEMALRGERTVHLTLGVMSCVTEEALAAAVETLRECDLRGMLSSIPATADPTPTPTPTPPPTSTTDCDPDDGGGVSISPPSTEPQPLTITLRSLRSMSAPSKTAILYATPDDATNRLYPFCTALRTHFVSREILLDENRPLKLHATIVNTVYAKKPQKKRDRGGGGRDRRIYFNATEILERERERVWCRDVVVGRVEICRMGEERDEEGVSMGYVCVEGKEIL
ncbi:hypothetical protein RUND412_009294 [Rhizina undulata]